MCRQRIRVRMNGSNHARALEPSSSRVHPFDLGSVSDDVTRGGLRGSCVTINQTESIRFWHQRLFIQLRWFWVLPTENDTLGEFYFKMVNLLRLFYHHPVPFERPRYVATIRNNFSNLGRSEVVSFKSLLI